jgi:hypothetical protein
MMMAWSVWVSIQCRSRARNCCAGWGGTRRGTQSGTGQRADDSVMPAGQRARYTQGSQSLPALM